MSDTSSPGSSESERELRALEERWEVSSPSERAALRPELESYVARFTTDPGVGRARLLLARLFVDAREYAAAAATLDPVLRGPSGRVRDEAEVVQAIVEGETGRPDAALARLEPLRGKLFTAELRRLWSKQRARAALETRRWRLVVEALGDWVAESGAERSEVEAFTRAAVRDIPTAALARVIVDGQAANGSTNEQLEAHAWVEKIIIERLTDEALDKKDSRLARDLLTHSPTWLRASEAGDELALLAALVEDGVRIAGRVVGVVVGGATATERQRTAQLASGILERLESSGDAAGFQLIAEENRGSISTALGTLSSRGASLLVAGVDAPGAELALKFAEARQIPLLTAGVPEALPSAQFGFVLGQSEAAEREALARALDERGVTRHVLIGGRGLSCESRLDRPGTPRFPAGEWTLEGVHGLILLADPTCAGHVSTEARGVEPRPWLAFGLEGAEGPRPTGFRVLSLATGRFPSAIAAPPTDRVSGDVSPTLVASWYRVLGRDVAALAQATLGRISDAPVSDERGVRERHDRVRAALRTVTVELESTESRGFAERQVLTRTLRVTDSHQAGAP